MLKKRSGASYRLGVKGCLVDSMCEGWKAVVRPTDCLSAAGEKTAICAQGQGCEIVSERSLYPGDTDE